MGHAVRTATRRSVRAKVTKRGLVIPKEMLADAKEADIRMERGRIIVSPVAGHDPIVKLGKNPVECGLRDASEHHDRYLYGSRS